VPYGLYISAEGAYAQTKRMEVLANNMANANTTAFKRDQPVFQARLAEATARGLDFPGSRSINDLGGGVEVLETVTDYSQAALKPTGVATDMAINGDGFFLVQKGADRLLTRAGNFQFNANGQLVTTEGYPVLSEELIPIEIDPTIPWQFTPDAGLQTDGDIIPLALVRPRSLGDLAKTGDNLYMPLAPTVPVEPEDRQIVTGHLETSGVKPALEIVELIETSRAFEANVAIIRNFDQLLGSLVNNVLKEG
jgi:flagellar basal-body rod protein FlgF